MAGRPFLDIQEPSPPRVALVIGTRPEAIKLAPVFHALTAVGIDPIVLLTGQHDTLLDPLIRHFRLDRRVQLVARRRDDLSVFTGRCTAAIGEWLGANPVAALLVQGDTSSALAGALAASLQRVPIGHVEAGLRTYDPDCPFPEELNRQLIARTARWHFAPTAAALRHLEREAVGGTLYLSGNTVVDAAKWTADDPDAKAQARVVHPALGSRGHVLVTAHRRESFGAPLRRIAFAIEILARRHPDLDFLVPLHPNPQARAPVIEMLDGRPNIRLLGPIPYPPMLALIASAVTVLTDSGGIQEEAPSFGVPVLVLRDTTERPEGIETGHARLVGTVPATIVDAFDRWALATRAPPGPNPYGDGDSAMKIAHILRADLVTRALEPASG